MRNHSIRAIACVETENIEYATAIYSESVKKTKHRWHISTFTSPCLWHLHCGYHFATAQENRQLPSKQKF